MIQRPLLILIDDEDSILQALERIFRKDFEILKFTDPLAALQHLPNVRPAILITDQKMPGMSGIDLLRQVKETHPTCIRVLLSGQIDDQDLSTALRKEWAHRFFLKPWDTRTLLLQSLEFLQYHQTLEQKESLSLLSQTDAVTGLFNHRFFKDQLKIEFSRAQRHGRPISLIMMDLDQFKIVNDTEGHPSGDQLLQTTAKCILKEVRTIDYVCRYGGDEFSVILPDTTKVDAYNIAERIRHSFKERTISLGISTFPDDASESSLLLEKADQALLSAKKQGKNRTVVA